MISVIIPTCDEAVALRATLDSGANISHRERCSRCSRKVSLSNNPPWNHPAVSFDDPGLEKARQAA